MVADEANAGNASLQAFRVPQGVVVVDNLEPLGTDRKRDVVSGRRCAIATGAKLPFQWLDDDPGAFPAW